MRVNNCEANFRGLSVDMLKSARTSHERVMNVFQLRVLPTTITADPEITEINCQPRYVTQVAADSLFPQKRTLEIDETI